MSTRQKKRFQSGSGLNDILKFFTDEKYPGEHHAPGYAYLGPGTRLDIAERRASQPINFLDSVARTHDLNYERIQNDQRQHPNKEANLKRVWAADDEFVRNASSKQAREADPLMAPIASNLIKMKSKLEQIHVLPTQQFSGFGIPKIDITNQDPALKLRILAKKYNKIHNKQQGGFAILAPILASIAGALVSKIYSTIENKIKGTGIKLHHKTIPHKRKFLMKLMKHIY